MSSRYVALAALTGALSACSGSSDTPLITAPQGTTRRFVITGGAQVAFAGDQLRDPIIVQLADASGQAVAEQRRIRFAITQGGGSISDTSVVTNASGVATTQWRLGVGSGPQQLTVSVAETGANTISSAVVNASVVSRDAADLIVITGLTSGTAGVLIQEDQAVETYAVSWPDTVLRLLPRSEKGAWQQVTAFSFGHPPEARVRPWTERIDTVRLVLRAPIAVSFTIWSTQNFDTTAAKAEIDLANTDAFWRSRMTGLVVGTVRIQQAPSLRSAEFCRDIPSSLVDRDAINVYYVGVGPEGGVNGYNCSPSIILRGPVTPLGFQTPGNLLLAHEVGHAFSLDHLASANTVMVPQFPIPSGLTTGQIYWMHFSSSSALNVVFGMHPAAEQNCRQPLAAQRFCPTQDFAAW